MNKNKKDEIVSIAHAHSHELYNMLYKAGLYNGDIDYDLAIKIFNKYTKIG